MLEAALDKSIDTIVPIGILGAGKSTLANILALQDDENAVPEQVTNQNFAIGSGEEAKTTEHQSQIISSQINTVGRKIKIVDSPGLGQSKQADCMHL